MILSLTHSRCRGLPEEKGRAAAELIRVLRARGVEFLPLSGSPETDPHPEQKVDVAGAISSLVGVEHPVLGKSFGHAASGRPRAYGSADLTFTGPFGAVMNVTQGADRNDPPTWNALADGLWRFSSLVRPDLRPDYGYLDRLGRNDTTNVPRLELKYLFWKNVFGPPYVEEYGRNFFLAAPGGCVEHPDGSVEYGPEPDFLAWATKPAGPVAQDALRYFRQKFPKIKLYHAKPVELPYEIVRMVRIDAAGAETVVYRRTGSSSRDDG